MRRCSDQGKDVYSRPCTIDAYDPARLEAVGVDLLDVGDVPPYLVHPRERRGDGGEQGECRPHVLVSSELGELCETCRDKDLLGKGKSLSVSVKKLGGRGLRGEEIGRAA